MLKPHPCRDYRVGRAGLVSGVLALLILAASFLYTRYSAMVGGDSYTYIGYARVLAQGGASLTGPLRDLILTHMAAPAALVTPEWNTAVLPDGRWVYTVAPGYPLLLAAMLRVGGEWLMLHANILLQVLGLACICYLIATTLRGAPRAGWAGLLGMAWLLTLNVATQHQFVMLWREPWIFLLLLLSALAYVGLDRRPEAYWVIPFLLGLACAVKESSIVYAGWMGVALLRHPAFRSRPALWRAIGLGILLFALGCAPLLIQNWSYTGRPWASLYVLRETSEFSLVEGGAGLSAGNFWRTLGRYLLMYRPYRWDVGLLVLTGAWGAWTHRKTPAVFLLGGWLLLHVALVLQWGNADFRHMYFANFPLVCLAAIGGHDVVERLASGPRWGWVALPAHAAAVALAVGVAIHRQPPRAEHRAGDWRRLSAAIEQHIEPGSVVLVNRRLRDVLGGYSDLHIGRLHELIHISGREPADLIRELAEDEVPVYFIDSPDRDPASVVQRANLTAMDWKYLLQGCDPVETARFDAPDRRIARFIGRSFFRLYRLEPWSRRVLEDTWEVPRGGAAFLALNAKGLEDDLHIEINGIPLEHDIAGGAWVPLDIAAGVMQISARRISGEPLPATLDWELVDWDAPIILPVGKDVIPDDAPVWIHPQSYQPVQSLRRFDETMHARVPVREGIDLFTVLQFQLPHTPLEGKELVAYVEENPGFAAYVRHHFLWIPLQPAADASRQATYRTVRVEVPKEAHLRVSRVISRTAWRRWPLPRDDAGASGLIVHGVLARMEPEVPWAYYEDDRLIRGGDRLRANPNQNPFAVFLPASRVGQVEVLRWEGAGLLDARGQPVGDSFRLSPEDALARALLDGFHSAESDATGSFRWTGPHGEIRLPAMGGSNGFRLRLEMANHPLWRSSRVAVSIGSRRTVFEVGNTVAAHEWDVDAPDVEGDWIVVRLEAEPWSPSDHGSRDSRTLGVRWYGVEWERLDEGGEP